MSQLQQPWRSQVLQSVPLWVTISSMPGSFLQLKLCYLVIIHISCSTCTYQEVLRESSGSAQACFPQPEASRNEAVQLWNKIGIHLMFQKTEGRNIVSSRAKADIQTTAQGKKTKTNACTSGQLKCLNSCRVSKLFLKNNITNNLEKIYNLRPSLQEKVEIILFIKNNQLTDLVTIYHQIWLLLCYLSII